MWVFLNNSFMSIVAAKGKKNMLLVRARVNGDIEKVFPKAIVATTPANDYRYRAFIPRDVVAKAMADQVRKIDYPNFKDSVKEDLRHDHYMQVWMAAFAMQRDYLQPKVNVTKAGRFGVYADKATGKRGSPRFDAWGDVKYD